MEQELPSDKEASFEKAREELALEVPRFSGLLDATLTRLLDHIFGLEVHRANLEARSQRWVEEIRDLRTQRSQLTEERDALLKEKQEREVAPQAE